VKIDMKKVILLPTLMSLIFTVTACMSSYNVSPQNAEQSDTVTVNDSYLCTITGTKDATPDTVSLPPTESAAERFTESTTSTVVKLTSVSSIPSNEVTTTRRNVPPTPETTIAATLAPTVIPTPASEATETSQQPENISFGKRNALASAKSYLQVFPFSYKGLIAQLMYEEFTEGEATYGADNCGADWN